jgi:hypothetical protein
VVNSLLTQFNETGSLSGSGVNAGGIVHYGSDESAEEDKMFGHQNIIHWVMEGVSYLTNIPEYKEMIMNHTTLIPQMVQFITGVDMEAQLNRLPLTESQPTKHNSVGCGTISDFGFVGAIFNLTYDPDLALSAEEREKAKQIEMLHEKAGLKEKRIHELNTTPYVCKRLNRLLDQNIGRALAQIGKGVNMMTESLQEMLAGTYLHLSRIQNKRGMLAADGAIRVLVKLSQSATMKCRLWGSQALARILISTNPHLALNNGMEFNVIPPLFQLLQNDDPVGQFEGLMALTNLASMGGDVAQSVAEGKRLSVIESLHHENEVHLRRAATELLCNLTTSERYVNALKSEGGTTRILILSKLVFEDDEATANAAMAIIASVCDEPEVQKHLLSHGDMECFGYAIQADRSEALQHRGIVAIMNLSENREIVMKMREMPSFLLDLNRLADGKATSSSLKESAKVALTNLNKMGIGK